MSLYYEVRRPKTSNADRRSPGICAFCADSARHVTEPFGVLSCTRHIRDAQDGVRELEEQNLRDAADQADTFDSIARTGS